MGYYVRKFLRPRLGCYGLMSIAWYLGVKAPLRRCCGSCGRCRGGITYSVWCHSHCVQIDMCMGALRGEA